MSVCFRSAAAGLAAVLCLLLAPPLGAQAVSDPATATAAAPAAEPAPPQLRPVTPENAAGLARAISAFLAAWFPSQDMTAVWTGEPEVTADGDVYRVRLPSLTALAGEEKIQVGTIALTLTPLAGEQVRVDAVLPETLQRVARDGSPLGTVTLADQAFTAVWEERLELFSAIDARIGRLAVARTEGAGTRTTATLANLALANGFKETGSGLWSGTTRVGLDQLAILQTDGQPLASLGKAAFTLDFKDANLARWPRVRASVQQTPTADRGIAAVDGVKGPEGWLDGAAAALTIADGLLRLPANGGQANGPANGMVLRFAEAAATVGIEGLRQDRSVFSVGFGHHGLQTEPPLGAFNPDASDLHLAVRDLPNGPLSDALTMLVRLYPANPQAASMMFSQQVNQALTQAGSHLKIETLRIDTPTVAGLLTGAARFTARAVMGATAEFDVTVRGLDEAMKTLEPKPGQSLSDQTQTSLAVMGMMQAMGQMGKDDQGRPVRTYHVAVTPDGKALLNGADMGAIARGLQGPPPAR